MHRVFNYNMKGFFFGKKYFRLTVHIMVTNKLLILHPNCPSKEELEAACQDDVTVVFYVPPSMYPEMERPESGSGTTNLPEATNLTELCKDATHVGLVWRNQGTQSIPFDGFEDMLHNGLTVDLITCNLGKEGFKERMQALEENYTNLQIRYSLDKTANPEQGGDWIMESHGTSVKSLYFTDALNTYTQVLDVNNIVIMYDMNQPKYVITSATNFTFVNNTVTITCSEVEFQGDISWPSQQYLLMDDPSNILTTAEYNNGMKVKISGLPGNKITITGSDYIGLIRNGAGGVVGVGGIISGLNVECATITGQGGGIIHKLANGGQQSHKLSIEDCTVTVTGSISAQRAGGICGTYAGSGSGDGNFAITRCSVTVGGSLSGQQSGGICGSHSQRCYITGCSVVVTGSISGNEAGGICGSYAGYQGWCYIAGCSVKVEGDISLGSGIGCAFGGYAGFCFVTGCSVKVVGNIGADAGAIYGRGVGIHNKPVGNSCYVDTTSTNVNFIGHTSWVPARDGATFSNCWISASTGDAVGGGVTNNITPSGVLTDINAAVLAYITNVLNTGSHNLGLVEISDMFELHNNGTANDPTDDYVMVKVEAVVDPAVAAAEAAAAAAAVAAAAAAAAEVAAAADLAALVGGTNNVAYEGTLSLVTALTTKSEATAAVAAAVAATAVAASGTPAEIEEAALNEADANEVATLAAEATTAAQAFKDAANPTARTAAKTVQENAQRKADELKKVQQFTTTTFADAASGETYKSWTPTGTEVINYATITDTVTKKLVRKRLAQKVLRMLKKATPGASELFKTTATDLGLTVNAATVIVAPPIKIVGTLPNMASETATPHPVDSTTGVYVPLDEGDYTVFNNSSGVSVRVSRPAPNSYTFESSNVTTVTVTVTTTDDTVTFESINFTLGTVHGEGGGGSSSGDPHVFPLQGPAYELPARQTCYRMLQGKNLTMNMSTRFVTKQEEDQIRAYYTSVTKTSVTKTPAPKSLVTNGVFYKKVFIESEGHTLEYNYDTNKGQCNSTQSNGQYFNISSSEGPSRSKGEECPHKKSLCIEFTHSVYGLMSVELIHFANPQLKYGVSCSMQRPTGLSGLLIKESKCKTMRSKLYNVKPIKIVAKRNVCRSKLIVI